MLKIDLKTFGLSLTMLVLVLCSLTAEANVPNLLSIVGPNNIAVGKTNVRYYLSYYFQGTITYCTIFVSEVGGDLIAVNSNHQTYVYVDAPTNECTLLIEATLDYEINPVTHESRHLEATKYVNVQKPILQTTRLGLGGISYTNALKKVPIHWNIDDDDRSGFDTGLNPDYGEDYLQSGVMSCNDDDLYSIQAQIVNTFFHTYDCDLKIKTPDSMRLWYTQNKDSLCCDADSVFVTNCNIKTWFSNKANFAGNRLYVEWVALPSANTNEYIEFYCNNVQFAKLRYKGYALNKAGSINYPTKSERLFFESNCQLDGCEWGINALGSQPASDFDSIAEVVDGEYWTKYGGPFVATTIDPICPDIYTPQNVMYSNSICRCMSMDTFNNKNHIFEEADAAAFFTISYFWLYNFLDINLHGPLGDLIYYSGPFAAIRVPSSWLVNCYPNWDMFTSRFFNQPRIVHRPYQLESDRTILDSYVKELP